MKKTQYVFALFEGGGAKGMAYAGVIKACADFGIRIEGACGVSAGAIAATLVAAGLTPGKISELLAVSLLDILKTGRGGFFRRFLADLKLRIFAKGLSSSEGIQHWIEFQLKAALDCPSPVLFKHLPRPLAILAYDAQNGKARIWSTLRTPEESVAFAVRASCTLPFVFAPVASPPYSYIDGGLIENAPEFLIQELNSQVDLHTLAFRLRSSNVAITRPRRFQTPLKKLIGQIGSLIDARTNVARSMHLDVRDIEIDCGNVDTADFHLTPSEVAKLALAGEKAIRDYRAQIDTSEGKHAQDTAVQNETWRQSKKRHANLARTGRLIEKARSTVEIFAGDISWLEDLAPYLLMASIRSVRISLVTHAADPDALEYAGRIGVAVGVVSENQPLRATVVDGALGYGEALIVEKEHASSPISFTESNSPHLLAHLHQSFSFLWTASRKCPVYTPILRPLGLDEIKTSLLRLSQYQSSSITFEELPASKVLPASSYVETFKLDRIERVQKLYESAATKEGYHITGTPWYSVWPVVERRPGGTLVVIDGTHRFFSAYVSGAYIQCIVVECGEDLPSRPAAHWSLVRITTAKLPRNLRYDSFEENNFRQIKRLLAKSFQEKAVTTASNLERLRSQQSGTAA
ncbi:putative esterase of the alpha-beta hydrolase superfamily [Polaromonas sp. CF318]|uniref:patatin-like phospholipase family protein n=1 Tax=Polaromonas sp. CF318 TaxID=1144318 RepID=UPI000270EB2B|nr:patatin-like phospholipase family protein [Polaromonas sp. CF318]EJL76928.1 putative esterase of the alpha-beta hydrolase superfamily [Polaromonas sp. CF318]